jgi:hypothetical protein
MDTTVCLVEGSTECYTLSPKVEIQWDSNVIYCGFRAAYKVTLLGVAENAKVMAFCRTSEGELLDEHELHMYWTIYSGEMLIPFNVVSGTYIYIEILLPEYGVTCKSVSKPVRNSISIKACRTL